MKRFFGLFLVFFLFVNTLSALQFIERRNVEDFHSVKIFGNIRAELIKSDSTYIVLESDVIPLSKVTTAVEKGEFKIELLNSLKEEKEVYVKIYYKQLDEIVARASANVYKTDVIKAKFLTIKLSQGALGHIKVETENLTVSSTQGSEVFLYGTTNTLNADINAGGKISAYKLDAKSVVASATAGGYIRVKPSEKLEAKATAGGFVYYIGEVKTISQKASLGGEVIKETLK